MRAFGWSWVVSLALGACGVPAEPIPPGPAGAPGRVASLNLCTDELLLLLAEPRQIASLTHLSHRPAEFPLWPEARQHHANDGTLADTLRQRPDLVLTMGGGGDRARIARRLGVETVDLPYPQSIDDVIASIRTVAARLGRAPRGEALIARLEALRASAPPPTLDALWIGGGGRTVAASGLEAEWMALAGLRQRDVPGGQVELETLLASPPALLLRSDYRADQYSRAQAWLAHPLAAVRSGSRGIATDGRRWTCMGPLLIDEIARLREEVRG